MNRIRPFRNIAAAAATAGALGAALANASFSADYQLRREDPSGQRAKQGGATDRSAEQASRLDGRVRELREALKGVDEEISVSTLTALVTLTTQLPITRITVQKSIDSSSPDEPGEGMVVIAGREVPLSNEEILAMARSLRSLANIMANETNPPRDRAAVLYLAGSHGREISRVLDSATKRFVKATPALTGPTQSPAEAYDKGWSAEVLNTVNTLKELGVFSELDTSKLSATDGYLVARFKEPAADPLAAATTYGVKIYPHSEGDRTRARNRAGLTGEKTPAALREVRLLITNESPRARGEAIQRDLSVFELTQINRLTELLTAYTLVKNPNEAIQQVPVRTAGNAAETIRTHIRRYLMNLPVGMP